MLELLHSPAAIRALPKEQLKSLAEAVRQTLITSVAGTGGHLGAGLGVVELTIALHYVFNTPDDRLIWDVGHQAYPHKIITERAQRMDTIRQKNGLSGFTKRSESPYDPFGAGHSSTSISAGLGFKVASELQGSPRHVIAVIGDGAMSAGMAYEAMNNAGALGHKLIVILNDNEMSIAPPVGAMSHYLNRLISSKSYRSLRQTLSDVARHLPRPVATAAKRAEEYTRGLMTGGTLFEELGFYYVGPLDGHNFDHLLPILKNVRDSDLPGPVLIHAMTQKGKGYPPAEAAADKFHGVGSFDISTGAFASKKAAAPSYTSVFANALIAQAQQDDRIVAITAAMPSGTGLDKFAQHFPDRCFDVGIAEQHAVTFAAGMAAEGMKPFCAIYSTFLQRAYDQIIHDVAIQKLPVRFAIDRAGLVGADGATHAGCFDIAYLACLPNMILMAASDEAELTHMVATAAACNDAPCALRYPRGDSTGIALPDKPEILTIGRGRIIREGNRVAILSYGHTLHVALTAADTLPDGLITVADARFAKPLDESLIKQLLTHHEWLITLEEGSRGGFGAIVLQTACQHGWLDNSRCRIRTLCLPDIFQDHASQAEQRQEAGIDAATIAHTIRTLLAID